MTDSWGAAAAGATVEDGIERARMLLDLGRPQEAIGVCGQVIAAAPDDPRGWALLCLAHRQLGELVDALAAVNTAVVLDPGNGLWHLHAGRVLLAMGNNSLAVAAGHEAVRLEPLNAEFHAFLALAYADPSGVRNREFAQRGRLTRNQAKVAEQHAQRAIELNPTLTTGHFAAGYVAAARRRRRAARKHYLDVLALNPHDVPSQNNLAALDLGRLRLGGAGAGFVGAVQTDPGFDKARLNVRRTIHAQLAVIETMGWTVYIAFFLWAIATSSDWTPGYRVQLGPRCAGACLVSVVGAALLWWCWCRTHPAVRSMAVRLFATEHRLWLRSALNLVVLGCFWVGAVGRGGMVGAVYLAGALVIPVAWLNWRGYVGATR